jgi:hypothetical protein
MTARRRRATSGQRQPSGITVGDPLAYSVTTKINAGIAPDPDSLQAAVVTWRAVPRVDETRGD